VKISNLYLFLVMRYETPKLPQNSDFCLYKGIPKTQPFKLKVLLCIELSSMYTQKKFQLDWSTRSWDIESSIYSLSARAAFLGLLEKNSLKIDGSRFFKTACVNIHRTVTCIPYIKFSKIRSSEETRNDFYQNRRPHILVFYSKMIVQRSIC
jgi:hypothetical protein